MKLKEYREFLSIKSEIEIDPILTDAVDIELKTKGFCIVRNIVDSHTIDILRDRWMILTETKRRRLSYDLSYGQENYVHDFFGKYTRHFDFYWNRPTCSLSRDISLLLHYARNRLTGFHPLYGLSFSTDLLGIYLAITHYPLGSGEMAMHVDPNYFLPVHFVLPLSFKGQDYAKGGLIVQSEGNRIDVDSQMDAGDVLLFNGAIPHAVERISGSGKDTSLGRLQMFSIPTQFPRQENKFPLRDLLFDAYGRFRYFLYGRGIALKKDYKNFR